MKYSYLFSDFDGTLTEKGFISADFPKLLEFLKQKKIELILVSGRSVSWGHFFLTHFPINFAIMESGGSIVTKNSKNEIQTKHLISPKQLTRLQQIEKKIKKDFPTLEFAQDNAGRIADRAIELSSLSNAKVQKKLCDFLDKNKCSYSVSNVHLNFSTLKMDKWIGTQYFIKKVLKQSLATVLKKSLYAGDSLNDEVMFEHMPQSLGVNNIKNYLPMMRHHPKILSDYSEIKGVLHFLKD